MKWIRFTLETHTDAVDILSYMLDEIGVEGIEIEDHIPLTEEEKRQMYVDILPDPEENDGSAKVHFYMEPEKCNPDTVIMQVQNIFQEIKSYTNIGKGTVSLSETEDKDWVNNWKTFFKPFRAADDVVIKPTWETTNVEDYAPEKDVVVEIDPGIAFGTGTHETTKLCIQALSKWGCKDKRIFDIGCGSGILAICSLLCGAKSAFCLDIDPYAVEATIENAALNNIEETRIKAKHLNILEDTENVRNELKEPVDIAVANILADVIIPLSDCIANFIKPGGLFISSGILAEKADLVEEALLKNNFEIIEKNTLGEWVSFVCKCK